MNKTAELLDGLQIDEALMSFDMRVEGLNSMAVAFVESEDALMDAIDSVQWLGVENRVGEPIWINTDKVVAFWESE